MTTALQVRFIRTMAKKKESPTQLTVPDLGKANAAGKGGGAKDGPDQPVIDVPWLGAHPVPGRGVARKGC